MAEYAAFCILRNYTSKAILPIGYRMAHFLPGCECILSNMLTSKKHIDQCDLGLLLTLSETYAAKFSTHAESTQP